MKLVIELPEGYVLYSCGDRRYRVNVWSIPWATRGGAVLNGVVQVFTEHGWTEVVRHKRELAIDSGFYQEVLEANLQDFLSVTLSYAVAFHDG